MKYLQPLPLEPHYYETLEKEINSVFAELFYRQLFTLLKIPKKVLTNSTDPLYEAVSNGRIEYEDGLFYGIFNARISAVLQHLGAVYNRKKKGWSLPRDLVPAEIQIAKASADSRYQALADSVLKVFDSVPYEQALADSLIIPTIHKNINDMNAAFYESVKKISIPPDLTPAARQIISQEWGNNLNLYIKDWVAENITELRSKVQANAYGGHRSTNLVRIITDNYGVSTRKAKFLARQETGLLMAQFHQTRYADVGITKYKWGGSNDERERHDHNLLNGKTFLFSSPPVTNRKTGARNNPTQDFGCRCVAIPIIE